MTAHPINPRKEVGMSKLFSSFYDVLLDDVLGSTSWHGETNADNESYQNMDMVEVLITPLLDRVISNYNLPENALATASGQKLQKQAERLLNQIKAQL